MARSSIVLATLFVLAACRTRPAPTSSVDGGAVPYRDAVVRACTIATACARAENPAWYALSISRCIDGFALGPHGAPGYFSYVDAIVSARLLACATSADCASFTRCFGGDSVQLSLCREGMYCDGKRLVSSSGNTTGSFDCAAIGLDCTELVTDALRACCTPRTCMQSYGVACDSKTTGTMCLAGAIFAVDCDDGLECSPGISDPACRGRGASCSPQATTQCNGSVATYCMGERQATFDCATNELRTACNPGGYDPCRAGGSACSPDTIETCGDGSLTVCVDGSTHTIDCRALGFAGCAQADSARAICTH